MFADYSISCGHISLWYHWQKIIWLNLFTKIKTVWNNTGCSTLSRFRWPLGWKMPCTKCSIVVLVCFCFYYLFNYFRVSTYSFGMLLHYNTWISSIKFYIQQANFYNRVNYCILLSVLLPCTAQTNHLLSLFLGENRVKNFLNNSCEFRWLQIQYTFKFDNISTFCMN